MYYIPSQYEKAYNFMEYNKGEIMDPDILMKSHRYISTDGSFYDKLPPAIKQGLIDHRKNQLNNTNYKWTGYKDCPFVNKRKVEEYKVLNDGWTAVTKDKTLSAQFEHTVGITENGYEIFTESAKGYKEPPYN